MLGSLRPLAAIALVAAAYLEGGVVAAAYAQDGGVPRSAVGNANSANEAHVSGLMPGERDPMPMWSCDRMLGVAGGFTPGGRDWDFTTPGPIAWTGSPVLSQKCLRGGSGAGETVGFIGVDILPWYQHSYRFFHARDPLLVLMDFGYGWRVGEASAIGLEASTNGVAWGGGLWWRTQFSDGEGFHPAIELRLHVLAGLEPDVQGLLLVRVLEDQSPGEDDSNDGIGMDGWVGFELGTVVGLRAEAMNAAGWTAGLRVGENTAFRRDVALMPLALGYVGVPLFGVRLTASGGVARYDQKFVPVTGAALAVGDASDRVRLQGGALFDVVDAGYVSPDITFAILW